MTKSFSAFIFGCLLATVAAYTVAETPLLAAGPQCPQNRPGACFIDQEAGTINFLFDDPFDSDGDGDVDFILIEADGFSDFLRADPNGRLYVHNNEKNVPMVWCPFFALDENGELVVPTDECVFGEADASATGFIGGPFGACPISVNIRGTGFRGSDGVEFDVRGRFVCALRKGVDTVIQFFIEAEESN